MKIIRQKKIEGCLEGTNVRDLMFDDRITRDFILYLGNLGKLLFTEIIKKPFFRIIVRGKYTLKGSQGNKTIRVLLPENANDNLIDELKEYISSYEKS